MYIIRVEKEKKNLYDGKKCCVKDCSAYVRKTKDKLYLVPQLLNAAKNPWSSCQRNVLRRKTWITNIGLKGSYAGKIYVCQNHFVSGI